MRPLVGIVADDLTGAADTGIAFLAHGMSAVVTWPPAAAWRIPDGPWGADVLAIDTRSRAASAEDAAAITRQVVSALREAGVPTLYKKIDSVLRGHVGDEVHAAIDAWHADSLAVVAPAFPGAGRTTVEGRQRVNGVPLAGSPPVATLLDRAGLLSRVAYLADVRGTGLASLLRGYHDAGVRAVVCDAETDHDLQAIARAGTQLGRVVVWAGSGGLARALPAELGSGLQTLTGERRTATPPSREAATPATRRDTTAPGSPSPARSLLIVVGSTSRVAQAQVDAAAAAGAYRVVVPIDALGDATALDERVGIGIVRDISARLLAGEDVLVTLAADPTGTAGDNPRIVVRLGELLRPCAPSVDGLILTGGDTAIGVLQAWGVTALHLVEEIDPGVVRSETIGGPPLAVITKSGSFGDPETLSRARLRLHVEMTGAAREQNGCDERNAAAATPASKE